MNIQGNACPSNAESYDNTNNTLELRLPSAQRLSTVRRYSLSEAQFTSNLNEL